MIDAVRRSALRVGGALIPSVVLVAVVAALVAATTAIVGYDPRVALGALWRGSLGTEYAALSATLVRATPLMLTGLAVTLAFTAGIMNIGAEGQLLAGATTAVAVEKPPEFVRTRFSRSRIPRFGPSATGGSWSTECSAVIGR